MERIRKIHKLKKWYSIEDSAKRLSQTLEEAVGTHDVRQFLADGHIAAYCNPKETYAEEVLPATIFYSEGDSLYETMTNTCPDFFPKGERISMDDFAEQGSGSRRLQGLFKIDVRYVGDADRWQRSIRDECERDYFAKHGAMLVDDDGKLWRLLTAFDPSQVASRSWHSSNDFYVSNRLPSDTEILISKAELEQFESRFLKRTAEEKPLSTKERNTLLTIIAALCHHSKINYQERGVAQKIALMTQEIGAPVDDGSIRTHLAQIPSGLETRMK